MGKDIFNVSIEWNDNELLKALDNAAKEVLQAVDEALIENAEDLVTKSKGLAPLDTGDLIRSITRSNIKNDFYGGKYIKVGANTPYALRMHEDFYNPGEKTKSRPEVDGMKAGRKYIERPLKKYADEYMKNIADNIRGRLK